MTVVATWIDVIAASSEEKQRYQQYKLRKQQLPQEHRAAVDAVERYLVYRGVITSGDILLTLLDDLMILFEECAADGTPVRAIVGDEPVAFAESLLDNHAEGQWIAKERRRLDQAIAGILSATD
ncbi:DUF1048 domain-containing protein [Agromyces salentinus]|uniref:DUF1048 domain-containing protein n=1 Tax=Agromyces salentinus TaxID=269421 RepID=A0ABN2MED0_9MICO|nr:DUF1048 domain-containing protein [Agromyces salentinus]